MNPLSHTTVEVLALALFGAALIHTCAATSLHKLTHRYPGHAPLWHLLSEVEVVFGLWAVVLVVSLFVLTGRTHTIQYLDSLQFTEPLFVFATLLIASTRPVLEMAGSAVRALARLLPCSRSVALYAVLLSVVPLLGSLITEPAAMTLAALMLRETIVLPQVSTRLKYLTLGVLLVNVSIGGTLTPFAAPPVLMVATVWQWDAAFMLSTFGWKAAIAVAANAALATAAARRELHALDRRPETLRGATPAVPLPVMLFHVLCLALVVIFAHHPVIFLGVLLCCLGFIVACPRYQHPLLLREALLVSVFLCGLVVLGGQQRWWLQPLLTDMSATTVFWGAIALTAITDNAALTYLGSLVPGLSPAFQQALVAGAVAGGGLTIMANAPNPAGIAILRNSFPRATVHPLGLLAAAALPTLVAVAAFRLL
jgi:Putative Na+/H+ antiporter